jgi:hypothetical protein
MEQKRRVVDQRKKGFFMMEDEYLNGMAKLCGWQGTIVYFSLCRHADIEQKCFPSIKLMGEENAVCRTTIIKGIESLIKRNVIEVKKKRTKSGQWLNNIYILLDKSVWDYSQVHDVDMDSQVHDTTQPSPCDRLDQVHDVDTKETHSEGNTYKETHISSYKEDSKTDDLKNNILPNSSKTEYGNQQLNEIIEFGFDNNFGLQGSKKENRRYAWLLYQAKGIDQDVDKIKSLVLASIELWGKEYKTQIVDWKSLYYNWGRLIVNKVQDEKNKFSNKIGVIR